MIAVGDKLGDRFFVTQKVEAPAAGMTFEVRDARSELFTGQVLAAKEIAPAAFEALRQKLSKVPAHPCFVRPLEVYRTPRGHPVAIYKDPPAPALTEALKPLTVGGVESRRLEVLPRVIGWFASFAPLLDTLHSAGFVHGAITLKNLHLTRVEGLETLALSCFGAGAAAQATGERATLNPRDDLAGVILSIGEVFERTGATPDPATLARWELLKRCAGGGDHPALASGKAMAASLKQLHEPPVARKVEPIGAAALDLKPGPAAPAAAPAAGRSAPVAAPAAFQAPPDALATGLSNRRRLVVGAVGGAVLLVTLAGVVSAFQGGTPPAVPPPPPVERPRLPRVVPRPTLAPCQDAPVTVSLAVAPEEATLGCGDGESRALLAFFRTGEQLHALGRPPTLRSAAELGPVPVAASVVELGTALPDESGGAWVATRVSDGAFAVHLFGPRRASYRPPAAAWRGAPLRGAMLLHADASGAWVASTLDLASGPYALVVRVMATEGSELEAYAVARGTVLAVLPGDTATVLIHERPTGAVDDAGAAGRLVAMRVPVTLLPGIADPVLSVSEAPPAVDAGAVAGRRRPGREVDAGVVPSWPVRPLRPGALQRAGEVAAEGRWVSAAPLGVEGTDGVHFAVSEGDAPPAAGCTGDRCRAEGALRMLMFPPQGEAMVTPLELRGRPVALHDGPEGARTLTARRAGDGVLMQLPVGSAEGPTTELTVEGAGAAAAARCGDETWLALGVTGNPPQGRVASSRCGVRAAP